MTMENKKIYYALGAIIVVLLIVWALSGRQKPAPQPTGSGQQNQQIEEPEVEVEEEQ